jgi:hypothetical protein
MRGNDDCSPTEPNVDMNGSEIGNDVSQTYRSGLLIFSSITIHFQLKIER